MTYRIHRMPLTRLLRFETATGHHYKHTVSKADPSIVVLTQAEIDRILDELAEMAETANRRWF